MFLILINILYIACVVSLEAINVQNGVYLKRQTTNTAPSFANAVYRASIPENQEAGYSVILLTAADPDQGENGKLTYSMTAIRDSRSNYMFTIDPISGIVKTTTNLDREEIPRHDFQVTATDNNVLFKKSAVTTLTITVEDVNDNRPVFDHSTYMLKQYESIPVGTTITAVRAVDRDTGSNGDIKYSIIEPSNQTTFQINASTGRISTLKVLDREVKANYLLVIQAKDQAILYQRLSSTASVSITILDVNDNAPMFTQRSYNVCVDENSATSVPFFRVLAFDLDQGKNQAVHYNITGGNTDASFRINSTSGEVFTQTSLDYTIRPIYRLQIEASDNGDNIRLSSTATLNVYVLSNDVDHNPPHFLKQNSNIVVPENVRVGFLVTTIQAVDHDSGCNSKLKYSFLHSYTSDLPFEIDANTGDIFVIKKLDREMQDRYSIEVQATNYGTPSLTTTSVVKIRILDVNDNAPMLIKRIFYINISDDTLIGHKIVQLIAKDKDISDKLTYSIISGNDEHYFEIHTKTGIVTLKKSLVFTKDFYSFTLTIHASDGIYFDAALVFINVTSSRPLSFLKDPYTFNVLENLAMGTIIGKVVAVNAAPDNNGAITYYLEHTDAFSIDNITGEIKTNVVLDREVQWMYWFEVQARAIDKRYQAAARISVSVIDVNDNAPSFTKSIYETSIRKPVKAGRIVINVHAIDMDLGINSEIRYSLISASGNSNDYSIVSTSGEIYVSQLNTINQESAGNYTLIVQAVDGGVVQHTVRALVKIRVEEEVIPVG